MTPPLTLPKSLVLVLLLLPAWAGAQTPYQVEMIVFATTDAATRETERWPRDAGQPDTSSATRLGADALISPGNGSLAADWDRLDTSGRYRPLAYFRWRQSAGHAGSPSRALVESPTRAGKNGPPEVLGTVAIVEGDGTEVDVDLVFSEKGKGDDTVSGYRLRERRHLKTDELHYLDHAVFGVLIQITAAR